MFRGIRRRAGARRVDELLDARPEDRRAAVDAASRRVLERNWVPSAGFTVPNPTKYPWQWLWDSCFHAIAWSALGDPRCRTELETLFSLQLPSGFVPHMGYQTDPRRSLKLWHSAGRSDITQPPMYGHALRVLAARGFAADHLHEPAAAGLRYLFEQRRDAGSGLIRTVHPWETGCDDSPRWDEPGERRFSERRWNARKRALARSIRLRDGAAWENPGFAVASAGFNALVAFNARELAALTGDGALAAAASELAAAIDARWEAEQRTWSDLRLTGPPRTASARTLDALLPILVSGEAQQVQAAFADIFDEQGFWRPWGPAGAAADEPFYDPGAYWRGDAWPQEVYLLMVAAARRGLAEQARKLAERLLLGCIASGYAERWNPETGSGLGAIPQGWAALAAEGARTLAGAGA